MMYIMRANNNNFRKNEYPTYQFILYSLSVSTGVSTLKKMVQWCIHQFRGMNDERKLVYKGGRF
jgi:hypothetical protein